MIRKTTRIIRQRLISIRGQEPGIRSQGSGVNKFRSELKTRSRRSKSVLLIRDPDNLNQLSPDP